MVEIFSPSKLVSLRHKWSQPDSTRGATWDFDGAQVYPNHWMSYNHEMYFGLSAIFGCDTFDSLVVALSEKLGRKPHVIDLMGGAYFLNSPENTASLTGIRVHDKDSDFLEYKGGADDQEGQLYRKIIGCPNRRIIEADILSNAGWNTIYQQKLPPSDLLVCRPIGPFDCSHAIGDPLDDPTSYFGLYASLFRRMITLVNQNTGIVFTEIPDIVPDYELNTFFSTFDSSQKCQTDVFIVPDRSYHWVGVKRRYAVIQFGQTDTDTPTV